MNGLRLYLRYAGISIRSQMQYRASFAMWTTGHFVITGGEFLGLWALMDRFGSLRGWSLPEVGIFYGLTSCAFAVAEAIWRGFDILPGLIQRGEFDRLLLRPRSAALQVVGYELTLMRLGRLLQGLLVLLWSATALEVTWTVGRALLVVWAVVGGACLFGGLLVAQATIAFWTIETLELVNVLTFGGVETAQYPLAIYRGWLRSLFTFLVPLACISYFPGLAVIGRPHDAPLALLAAAPAAGVLFLGAALAFWRFGVRHHTSTGS